MDQLPNEVQTLIYSYCSDEAVLYDVSRTCKSWFMCIYSEFFPFDFRHLSNRVGRLLIERTSNISYLSIDDAGSLDASTLNGLTQKSKIHTLKLGKVSVTELDVSQCLHLCKLNVAGSKELRYLKTASPSTLEHLILDDCENFKLTYDLVSDTPNLKTLSVKRNLWFDSSDLESFMPILTKLQVIMLQGCTSVSDMGLFHLRCCLHLRDVQFGSSKSITDFGIKFLTQQVDNKKLSLQSLELSGINQLTDSSLIQISNTQQHLLRLSLSQCTQLFSDIQIVNAFTKGCCMIKDINLSFTNVDDGVVQVLIDNLRLENLNLAFCKFVTDDGIGYVAKHAEQLIVINISSMQRLSHKGVKDLLRIKSLKKILLNSTQHGITKKQLENIMAQKPDSCVIDLGK
ncbi:F-box/LRR-repeat protein FBXL [Acrasis kona]|uniref:F-box/LRR-repeat protein FBXL n=1 Tax=Acrasis kona TaxID=1008807 RepID=A0AAW2ZNX7_9EUKA